MANHYLFAYGTLMQGLEYHSYIADTGGIFVATATIPGRLYMCDDPALVEDDEGGVVHGELYQYEHLERAIPLLDEIELEGTMYKRIMLTATLADGRHVEAVTYLYNVSVRSCTHIPSGDYRVYLHDKALTPEALAIPPGGAPEGE